MSIDLEAIRARNEARRAFVYPSNAVPDAYFGPVDDVRDIDALLAEVERLRAFAATVRERFGIWPADDLMPDRLHIPVGHFFCATCHSTVTAGFITQYSL